MGRITNTVYKVHTDEEGNQSFYYEQSYVCGNNKCENYKKDIGSSKMPIDVEPE